MKKIAWIWLLILPAIAYSQDNGFPFGKVTYNELQMKTYEADTSASAVVLNEFGEAFIDSENDFNLVFRYHAKIKILKTQGLDIANFEISLWKQNKQTEKIRSIKASSFNMEDGNIKEAKLEQKNIFTENENAHVDNKKFAIPNVRVGSVIEVDYVLESPFIFNFRPWSFQSELPKVYSEYWALIPGNYLYNMTLKGYLTLFKNESTIVQSCFNVGGGKADCALYKFAMKNVPAFVEEDYMTAKSNFVASINFELSEVKYFDGRTDKLTKEWKDAELELRKHEKFGLQLKKGKDIADQIEALISGENDPLLKAKKVHNFITSWYHWNESYGMFSESGIGKAFEKKSGNVGDINLSLIAALRYAGLVVEPVILSTRANGLPIEIHPVLSDFNYVVAKVAVGGQSFLVDATDSFYPFGVLPERCLNGKGRALSENGSYWVELNPAVKSKQMSMVTLKLDADGFLRGTLQNTYYGYEAIRLRKKISTFSNQEEYNKDLTAKNQSFTIKSIELTNVEDISQPISQKFEIEIPAFEQSNANTFLFNPFLTNRWNENPFKSTQRLYPVDFGVPFEEIILLNIQFPEQFEIVNLPDKTGLSLPNTGGRYIVDGNISEGVVSLSSSLIINKPIFSSQEYRYLKELFSRVLQVQNTDLLFKRKL